MKLGRQVDICVTSILTKYQLNRTLFIYPNCLFPKTALCWNYSSLNWQNWSQIWTSTDPNPKQCNRIEVPKASNRITKFGANPSGFEPPTTSLNTYWLDLRNWDKFTSSSSSSLFSLGCGVLVWSLTLSYQQSCSWLALLLSHTATKGG
jgi:hypothetical protein